MLRVMVVQGVSDTFIAALWALDWLPEISKTGASSQNFHGGPSGTYPPIAFSKTGAIEIRPLYYGLLLFSELVANYSQWVSTSSPVTASGLPINAVAHATVDTYGRVKVLLVAKDLAQTAHTASVAITITRSRLEINQHEGEAGRAHIVRLAAPNPTAKTGIKLAGQTFDGTVDGSPRGARVVEPVKSATGRGGKTVYEVKLPAHSAAMLVVS